MGQVSSSAPPQQAPLAPCKIGSPLTALAWPPFQVGQHYHFTATFKLQRQQKMSLSEVKVGKRNNWLHMHHDSGQFKLSCQQGSPVVACTCAS